MGCGASFPQPQQELPPKAQATEPQKAQQEPPAASQQPGAADPPQAASQDGGNPEASADQQPLEPRPPSGPPSLRPSVRASLRSGSPTASNTGSRSPTDDEGSKDGDRSDDDKSDDGSGSGDGTHSEEEESEEEETEEDEGSEGEATPGDEDSDVTDSEGGSSGTLALEPLLWEGGKYLLERHTGAVYSDVTGEEYRERVGRWCGDHLERESRDIVAEFFSKTDKYLQENKVRLRDLVDQCDADSRGFLDLHKVEELVNKVAPDEFSAAEIKCILAYLDINDAGAVTYETVLTAARDTHDAARGTPSAKAEVLAVLRRMTAFLRASPDEAFEMFAHCCGEDGGRVGPAQLAQFFRMAVLELTEKEVRYLMAHMYRFDASGDGTFSFREVQFALHAVPAGEAAQHESEPSGSQSEVAEPEEPAEVASPTTAGPRRLTALLRKGIPYVTEAVQALEPMLPFPGGQAAALVGTLLGLVERAIANRENLEALRLRAVAYLDLLEAYHPTLVKVRAYKTVVEEYKECLTGIKVYSEKYCTRNCIMRLFTGSSDQSHYEELCTSLSHLTEKTTAALQMDTVERTQDVQDKVDEALQYLKETAPYFNASARAKQAVDAAGGLNKVLAQPQLLQEVVGKMDVSFRITIEMVTSLLRAHADKGPHRHIRHPDLQVFWQEHFSGDAEVPWNAFTEFFPKHLSCGVRRDESKEISRRLQALLRSSPAQRALRRALDRDNDGKISVYELRLAFSADQALEDQVSALLKPAPTALSSPRRSRALPAVRPMSARSGGGSSAGVGEEDVQAADGQSDDGAWTHGPDWEGLLSPAFNRNDAEEEREEEEEDSESSDRWSYDSFGSEFATRIRRQCMLPPLDAAVMGREDEAGLLAQVLLNNHVVLLADGGMGKSSLAAQAGWLLYHRKVANRGTSRGPRVGALWVDLREAQGAVEVEARFCAALGMQREEKDNVKRICAALREASRPYDEPRGPHASCQLLLVVDNAEDPLHQEGAAAALRSLLEAVTEEDMSGLRVMVTSREAVGVEGRHGYIQQLVRPLKQAAAEMVVSAIAEDLSPEQVAEVATACRCVPLYLRLVSEAIVAGRLTQEQLTELAASAGPAPSDGQDCGDGSTGRDNSSSRSSQTGALMLVLGSLKPAHQEAMQQLAVLPAGFDADAAAVVLSTTPEQARALLAVLFRNSLLQRAGTAGADYVIHKAVRQALLAMGKGGNKAVAARQEVASILYALHMLRQLGHWAEMYRSNEFIVALGMARDRQPDLGWLAEVLGAPAKSSGGRSGRGLQAALFKAIVKEERISVALSYKVCALLEALGVLTSFDAGWQALGSAAERAGEVMLWANFLALQARVCFQRGQYEEGEAKAKSAMDLMSRAGQPAPSTIAASTVEDASGGRGGTGKKKPQRRLPRRADVVASILNNLAICIKAQGQPDVAEQLLRHALDVRKRAYGDKHPDSIGIMQNLASSLKAQGRKKEAEVLYREVLELREKVLSRAHPDIAVAMNSLANCMEAIKPGSAEAEGLYETARELQRSVLGDEHPHTLATTSNLARCLLAQGKFRDAVYYARTTVPAQEQILGKVHPSTMTTKTIHARALQAEGEYEDAEKLYREILAVDKEAGGKMGESTAALITVDMAICISKGAGNHKDAEPLFRSALETLLRLNGPKQAETLAAQHCLANCLLQQRRYPEAQELYEQTAEVRKEVLGEDEPLTLGSLEGVAICTQFQGKHAEAEALLRQVLDASMRVRGVEHADTVGKMMSLAKCLMLQGRFAEALPIHELAKSMAGIVRRDPDGPPAVDPAQIRHISAEAN